MKTFTSPQKLIEMLYRERKLLTELFQARRKYEYTYQEALEFLEENEARLESLLAYRVLVRNGDVLEIDEPYLSFLEQVLEVNEEINTAYINENIAFIKENINYYLNEKKARWKYKFLQEVKKTLRNIGLNIRRSVIDLKRNVDRTYKNEPNYKNKKLKLETLDQKRKAIYELIQQTEYLIEEESSLFFRQASDENLRQIRLVLQGQLKECRHNLIEIQKQIIAFLNQITYHFQVVEKIHQLKDLKDQFLLKHDTNIEAVLARTHLVAFEPRPTYPLKLSLEALRNNDKELALLKQVIQKNQKSYQTEDTASNIIEAHYLQNTTKEEVFLDLNMVKNSFVLSGNNLFDFVMEYPFEQALSFERRVGVFGHLVAQYDDFFQITTQFGERKGVQYALIYPK